MIQFEILRPIYYHLYKDKLDADFLEKMRATQNINLFSSFYYLEYQLFNGLVYSGIAFVLFAKIAKIQSFWKVNSVLVDDG